MPNPLLPQLGSEAPRQPLLQVSLNPSAFATPGQFSETLTSEELAQLSQLAAQILANPLALRQLSDRVVNLMQQDLALQRERDRGYGGRW
jgi:hypothetical protein